MGGRIDRRGTGTHGHRLAASSGSRSPGRPVTPPRPDHRDGRSPPDVRRSFTAVADTGLIDHDLAQRLAPSAGLRDVLVHAYVDLDLARVVAAVPLASEQYAEYVRQVARWMADRNG
ncbi:MAG TPA: HepT-like ribonuclease domain-containing protein [Pseudonocardia sp.]|nr:HepT-like ribonuclease domain-containing protein [Pseudonocardia sp.]